MVRTILFIAFVSLSFKAVVIADDERLLITQSYEGRTLGFLFKISDRDIPYKNMLEMLRSELKNKVGSNTDATNLNKLLVDAFTTSYGAANKIPNAAPNEIYEKLIQTDVNAFSPSELGFNDDPARMLKLNVQFGPEIKDSATTFQEAFKVFRKYYANQEKLDWYSSAEDIVNPWTQLLDSKYHIAQKEMLVSKVGRALKEFGKYVETNIKAEYDFVVNKSKGFAEIKLQMLVMIHKAFIDDYVEPGNSKDLCQRFDEMAKALRPLFDAAVKFDANRGATEHRRVVQLDDYEKALEEIMGQLTYDENELKETLSSDHIYFNFVTCAKNSISSLPRHII